MPSHYSLQVLRVQDVTYDSSVPKLYAEVQFGDVTKRTRTIRDTSPTWNETLRFSSPDASMILNIRVKDDASHSKCVGYVDIKLHELLENCANGEVQLKLSSAKSPPTFAGIIHLHFKVVDSMTAVGLLIKEAKQAVQERRLDHSPEAAASTASTVTGGAGLLSDLCKSLWSLLSKLDAVVQIMDEVSKVHPYVSVVWQATSILYKIVSHQFKTDQKLVELVHAMDEAFDFVTDANNLSGKTQNLKENIIKLVQQTTECCLFVQDYASRGFAKRMLKISSSQKIDDFKARFADLKNALDSDISLHTAFVSGRILIEIGQIALEQQHSKLLERLKPEETDAHDRRTCFEDTCLEIRNEIMASLLSDDDQNILWLHGVAGSGKSTIATTIEEHFRDMSRLGAFLFFERGKSQPGLVIRTIAYKLAMFDPSIASHIAAAVERDNDIAMAVAATQFEKLLVEPLKAAAPTIQGPIVIVLDAMDECGTTDARATLMHHFQRDLPKLPKCFRFLITSRRERDIEKALSCEAAVRAIELDYKLPASHYDVLRYIDHEMRMIFAKAELEVPTDWPWDANISLFGKTAHGLFIWGSTAVKLVSAYKDDPFGALEDLVSYCRKGDSNSFSLSGFGLDDLYATVLSRSEISWQNPRLKTRFSQVLGLILLSKIPLSITAIDEILGFPKISSSRLIIERLQSVLAYTPDVLDAPVRLFHTSFSDYLMSPKRSADPWFIEIDHEKQTIASRCFDVMAKLLCFNICNLETSFVGNEEVAGLKERIKEKIPLHLEYACRFWAEHLCDVPYSPNLVQLTNKLTTFARHHLLYWFEVLSLTKLFRRLAGRALLDAVLWTALNHSETSSFLWDAYRLASIFALPISQSTPHIYLSALILSKGESAVSDHYSKAPPVVRVYRLGTKASAPCIKTFQGHTHASSVAFSPDGKRVVSGSSDNSIRVWDAESGEVVSGPFEGHTSSVWSVAFSPDGKRVVSGSSDYSIRVWDAESGEVVSGPFEGHTSSVWSVAFSPDGKRVVSGSVDCSIRVWDAESGEVVSGPFEGHTDSVWSVAFSPDGKRVVSGSSDYSIRVWDAESGEVVSGPFEGHTSSVNSVAFSPDGKRVASGSDDCSIRVWNAESGEIDSGLFEGLADVVSSAAFSPDEKHIVSGSQDESISVPNIGKANMLSTTLEECTNSNWVMSEDGWIIGKQGELLIWIPPDIRPTLWRPRNTAVFSCRFSTRLDFMGCALGTDWQKGFNMHK